MIDFLAPGLFTTLLGIAIPLAIHLWNRKQGKIIRIGSIELLRKTTHTRVRRILFSEPLLFLLRMLTLILFTLLLAKPIWISQEELLPTSNTWVLIDPRLEDSTGFSSRWKQHKAPIHLLSQTFPPFNPDSLLPLSAPIDTWSLLGHLSMLPDSPDSIIVYSYSFQRDFQGKCPTFPFAANWIVLPFDKPAQQPIEAISFEQGFQILHGISQEQSTRFFTHQINNPQPTFTMQPDTLLETAMVYDPLIRQIWIKGDEQHKIDVSNPDTIHFHIYVEAEFEAYITYFKAAIEAINTNNPHHITLNISRNVQEIPDHPDWITWLSKAALPDTLTYTNGLLYVDSEHKKNIWINPDPANTKKHIIHASLDKESENIDQYLFLPGSLVETIWGKMYRKKAEQLTDMRQQTPDQILHSTTSQKMPNLRRYQTKTRELEIYLWLLLCLVFIMERFYVYRRNQHN